MTMIATLVLMIILVTTVVITGNDIKNSTYMKSFGSEMYSVKTLIEDYEFMYDKYPFDEEIFEFNISSIPLEYRNQFEGEEIINNKIIFYKINYAKAGINELHRGLKKINDLDTYVYSTRTGKIYYLYGEKIDDYKYYTLTDEIYKEIGINEIK